MDSLSRALVGIMIIIIVVIAVVWLWPRRSAAVAVNGYSPYVTYVDRYVPPRTQLAASVVPVSTATTTYTYTTQPKTVQYVYTTPGTTTTTQTVCPMDAMQCPNGTYVGRTGPQCSFAPCK